MEKLEDIAPLTLNLQRLSPNSVCSARCLRFSLHGKNSTNPVVGESVGYNCLSIQYCACAKVWKIIHNACKRAFCHVRTGRSTLNGYGGRMGQGTAHRPPQGSRGERRAPPFTRKTNKQRLSSILFRAKIDFLSSLANFIISNLSSNFYGSTE